MMSDIDPLDVALVLSIPAFLGSAGSIVYDPLFLLNIPLLVGFVVFLSWMFFDCSRRIVGALR